MADKVHITREAPGPAGEPSSGERRTAIRADRGDGADRGQHYRVGVFNLPTSLAGYGPITLVSMVLTTVGALALAMLFAALSRRLPADGGPVRLRAGRGSGIRWDS